MAASRSRGRRPATRSGGGSLNSGGTGMIIGAILVGAIVFAFLKIPTHQTAGGVLGYFEAKAAAVSAWVDRTFGDGISLPDGALDLGHDDGAAGGGGTDGTTAPVTGDAATSLAVLGSLKVEDALGVTYNRDEWRHWNNITSCWNVRDEVLYRQAQPGSLTMLDKNKQVTADKAKACSISGGTWVDAYTGQTFTNPEDLDIDHMIPLGYAARHGGQPWSEQQKQDFANDMDSRQLIAVFSSANRQKSDRGPSEWQPQASYQCQYAKDWVEVSAKWQLSITQADKDALTTMLATCS